MPATVASDKNQQSHEPIFQKIHGRHGLIFRQKPIGRQTGFLMLRHNGHDHICFDYREKRITPKGRNGDHRIFAWSINSQTAVELATTLLWMVDYQMRDSDESPYRFTSTAKEKASFGPNWVREDAQTANERLGRRKSRSHLFGLMQRYLECCEDDAFVRSIAMALIHWADTSDDEFAKLKALKAAAQLRLIDPAKLDS